MQRLRTSPGVLHKSRRLECSSPSLPRESCRDPPVKMFRCGLPGCTGCGEARCNQAAISNLASKLIRWESWETYFHQWQSAPMTNLDTSNCSHTHFENEFQDDAHSHR